MRLLCMLFNFCRRETTVCRCRWCGREMHDWREGERRTVEAELLGVTSQGRMRYEETICVENRCEACGAVQENICHVKRDH